MKSTVFVLLLFLISITKALGQISPPYYQSFDEIFSFWKTSELNPNVPNHSERHWDLERWSPRRQSTYIKAYWNVKANGDTIGYPDSTGIKRDLKPYESIEWDESERYSFYTEPTGRLGKVIKLTTLDQYDNAGGIEDTVRSRTEMKIFPYHGEGEEYFYAWRFLIPDTDEHTDDIVPDNIIAQWHIKSQTVWENNRVMQPPFFLIYKNDQNRSQSDKKRNLHIMYGFRYSDNGNQGDYKSFTLTDAVEKGKWQDVIMHVKWSSDPSVAFMEIWLNNVKVVDPNTGESTFYKANLYKDAATLTPQPNYFKVGQYRSGQTISQTIYIDDFRIGNTKEEVNLSTSLINDDCGTTLTYDDMTIHCHEVIGAKGYHFYFTSEDQMVYSESPSLDLSRLDWIDLSTTYDVRCRVALYDESNKTDLFGPICQVTTPPPFKTKLVDTYCGSTLPSDNLVVEAYPIPGATQYKFYVSGVTNPINRDEPFLNLGDYDWFNFNSSYDISVRVSQPENAGLINHIGDVCTVHSPLKTRLKAEYCGTTLPSNDLTVRAYPVSGATQYKFYVSGVANPINRDEPFLNLGDYGWFNFNSSYDISVRVSQPENAGLINHIGDVCTVHSPLKTRLKAEYCGTTLPSNDLTVRAYPVSGATQYKFYVSGVANPINRDEPFLNLGDYGWFNFNSSYDISVRVSEPANVGLINHTGETCTVAVPGSSNLVFDINELVENKSSQKNIIVYPNPSNGFISIDGVTEKEVDVNLFGVNGKRIDFEAEGNENSILIKTNFKGLVLLAIQRKSEKKIYKVWIK